MPSMPVPELPGVSKVSAVLLSGYNMLNLQLIFTVRDFCARISGVQLHGFKTSGLLPCGKIDVSNGSSG